MIEIYYTSFADFFPNELWEHHLSGFSPEIQQKIMRYKMQKNQHQALLGKLLLQKVLEKYAIPQRDLANLKYTAKGKPYFEEYHFHFNITHSDNIIMCAFAEKPVGVDVEKMKEVNFLNFKLFFSPSELLHIQHSNNPKQTFFEYWTLKESILKLTGEGISANLLAFQIEKEKVLYFENVYFFETRKLSEEVIFTVSSQEKIETQLTYFDFSN